MPALTVLQLNPSEVLEFPSAKLRSVSIELNLKNVSDKCVAYKIKTTAPKSYLVRPSTGVVAPGEEQDVQIILQPQQTLPESNKDRFLVQAAEVDSADVELTRDFWISVSKELLQDHRLSVTFKPAEGAAAAAASISPRPAAAPSTAPLPPPSTVPAAAAAMDNASDLRRPAAFPPPAAASDFEAKYNDLLQYCLALDKQKTVIAAELNESQKQLETLKQRLKVSLCTGCGGTVDVPVLDATAAAQGRGGLAGDSTIWRMVALVVLVVIVLKLFNFL